jgi:hypothetical protein
LPAVEREVIADGRGIPEKERLIGAVELQSAAIGAKLGEVRGAI